MLPRRLPRRRGRSVLGVADLVPLLVVAMFVALPSGATTSSSPGDHGAGRSGLRVLLVPATSTAGAMSRRAPRLSPSGPVAGRVGRGSGERARVDGGPSSGVPTGPPGVDGRQVEAIQATAHVLYADVLGTCLACTSAEAGHDHSGAEARGTRLANEPVSEGQGPANGYGGGALLTLPSNGVLVASIDEWDATSGAGRRSSTGHAHAALLDLDLIAPGVLHVGLAEARSDASSYASRSDAHTEADVVHVAAFGGAIRVVLLHSDSTAGAPGHAYLLSANGDTLVGAPSATERQVAVGQVVRLGVLRADRDGAEVGSARDGRSQPVMGLATVRNGRPDGSQSEPLR